MATTVQDILDILDSIAPVDLTEEWDNTGLLVGDPKTRVTGLLLALDPTLELIDQAVSLQTNLIITHHPLIFQPIRAIRSDLAEGGLIHRAVLSGINMIACHTNLDMAQDGVNDVLANLLKLDEIVPLTPCPRQTGSSVCGMGRMGKLRSPLPADRFIEQLKMAWDLPWLLTAGRQPAQVQTVALCGGSGSELAETAWRAGADVFITAEVKHAVARWAEISGLWIIDGGHFSTENPVIPALRDTLEKQLRKTGAELPLHSAEQSPPLRPI